MKVHVVNPQAWMLTSESEARRQLARCAFAAGLSRGRLDKFRVANSREGWQEAEDEKTWAEAEALVQRLLNMKPHPHATVIEHSAITFLIRCSRIASHEIVRHRLAAITQQSTRYCESGKDGSVTFIRPLDRPESDCGYYDEDSTEFIESVVSRSADPPVWISHAADAVRSYRKERECGRKREFARYLLPHHIEVWLAMTANFREWRHVLRMRTQKAAAPEMRLIFGLVKEELRHVSPVLVEGL